jgi:hypothetical protein
MTLVRRRVWCLGIWRRSVQTGRAHPTAATGDLVPTSSGKRLLLLAQSFAVQKNGVFWDVTPSGSCKNRRFRGTKLLLHQGDKNR